jgi:hypothetical protein
MGVAKKINGKTVRFISPEDLILSKLLWYQDSASTCQLEDIEGMLQVSKVNMTYVKKWTAKHRTQDLLEKVIDKIKKEKT